MCGLVGFVNTKKDVSSFRNVLSDMNNSISRRDVYKRQLLHKEN